MIMPVYWYIHCDFQPNIALFCAISDLDRAIAVIRQRIVSNTVAIQVTIFFQGEDIGRDVPMEIVVI